MTVTGAPRRAVRDNFCFGLVALLRFAIARFFWVFGSFAFVIGVALKKKKKKKNRRRHDSNVCSRGKLISCFDLFESTDVSVRFSCSMVRYNLPTALDHSATAPLALLEEIENVQFLKSAHEDSQRL